MRGGHVTNLLSFAIGWFACVMGAANGTPSYGVAVAAMLLALNILVAEDALREARVIVAVGALGFGIDTILALAGILVFDPHTSNPSCLCPIWLAVFGMLWGSTCPARLNWPGPRPATATIIGSIAGPLNYFAAAKMGALAIPLPIAPRLATIAIVWAVIFPGLLKFANRRS